MDYAEGLLGTRRIDAESVDWAAELTKSRGPKSLADVQIANEGGTEGTAGFGTLVKGGMVEDPQTKIDIFAKARFPNMPLDEARSRYGVIDGEVVYVGPDDKVYRETPSGIVGGAKRIAADVVSNTPAVIGGTVGAMAGAPAGPAASASLAALGAAGGKGYGRVAAGLAFGEPQTTAGNVSSMAKEAAFTGGATLVGNYLGRVLSGTKARDIRKLDPNAVSEIDRKAAIEGIDLNVAQRTNLPSMKSRYDALASLPTSRDTIADFAKKQSEQANVAVDRFLNKVSPVEGLDEAGMMARQAAGDVLKKLTAERASEAAPYYQKAFTGNVTLPKRWEQTWEALMESPTMQQAKNIAMRMEKDDIAKNKVMDFIGKDDKVSPINSIRGMHYMKLALDRMIAKEPMSSASSAARKTLVELKDGLLTIMDDISPRDQAGNSLYQQGRKIFAHYSPNIESVKEGVIARIADLPDEKVADAAKQMFNPNMSPAAVSRARELFTKSGREDDWNALLRSYLQEKFGNAGREFATAGGELGQSVRWRAMLFGDPAQRRVIRSAMTDQQHKAYVNMMDVFDAMSKTYGSGLGSQTMPRQEAAKVLRDEATGVVAKAITPANSLRTWLQEVAVGKHAEKMAEVMTSPEGMKKLKELAQMSPASKKFIAGASALFGISARPAARPSEEQVPPALQ